MYMVDQHNAIHWFCLVCISDCYLFSSGKGCFSSASKNNLVMAEQTMLKNMLCYKDVTPTYFQL